MGIGFCHFLMLIKPPYFTGLTFIGYLAMPRLFYPHSIHLLVLAKLDLVLPPIYLLLIMPTSKPPLGSSRRSKYPFKHMLLLRMPLYVTFSKSTTTSSVECLLPRLSTIWLV